MSKLNFKGIITDSKLKHEVQLSLFCFVDEGCKIIYSPALDLSGYGKTETEAKLSFEEALKEFVHYTTNKNTLLKVLKKLGWDISRSALKKHKPAKAPELVEMLSTNEYLANIFETKNFKKYNESIALLL